MDKPASDAKRAYRMTARAEATAQTRRRILEATIDLFTTTDAQDITLEAIARAAGVTVPTVLRHFGSKEQLLEATERHARESVIGQRYAATPGDVAGAVENLMEHYELWGDRVLRLLAREGQVPAIRAVTNYGRGVHREWVERTFAPLLPRDGPARARRVAQLVAVCDVYVWKVLRRDLGLSREETAQALLEIITAL